MESISEKSHSPVIVRDHRREGEQAESWVLTYCSLQIYLSFSSGTVRDLRAIFAVSHESSDGSADAQRVTKTKFYIICYFKI